METVVHIKVESYRLFGDTPSVEIVDNQTFLRDTANSPVVDTAIVDDEDTAQSAVVENVLFAMDTVPDE